MKSELFILGLLAAASPLYAIVDSQPNGMSDLWEKHYNSGTLFSGSNPDHAASADPDGDGIINEDEAVMGTDPFSSNMPDGVVRCTVVNHPASPGMFTLFWPSISGKVYKLSTSTDLVSWADSPDLIAGDGTIIPLGIDVRHTDGTVPEKTFWRVVIEDEDPDGDTLSTWEELQLGYNPYHPDSDLDGIADNVDAKPLVSASQADPDGANLPASLTDNKLIGRWDFESASTASGNHGFPSTPASTGACQGNIGAGWSPHHGIVSHGAVFPNTGYGYLSFPHAILQSRSTASFAFWIQLPEDQLNNLPTGKMELLGIGQGVVGSPFPIPELHAYLTSDGKLKMESDWVNFGSTSQLSSWSLPADFDDGKWHHLVIIKNGGSYSGYVDGMLIGSTTSNNFTFQFQYQPYFILGRRSTSGFTSAGLQGKIDRFRVYSKSLSSAEATALYEQDIDRDGLYDRNEGITRLWRDLDSDAFRDYLNFTVDGSGSLIPSNDEVSHIASPYLWDAADADHDDDGAYSLDEQNVHLTDFADPDTDDDLLPDGWEIDNGLNALVSNAHDANSDGIFQASEYTNSDTDPLTDVEEYQNHTAANSGDSDGDGVSDAVEIDQLSDPHDPNDKDPVPADQRFDVLLGIGDQSGSESEDYELHCFKIDKETGEEKEFYTVRSGGFGEYKEETKAFRKDTTYTFQIDWRNTNGQTETVGSTEGPDFDYTFKVQPQTDNGSILIDSWSSINGVDSTNTLLDDDASDVATTEAEFSQNFEAKRVVLLTAFAMQVFETDQICNKAPNPKKPGYSIFGTAANASERATLEDQYYDRLFVAEEPSSGKAGVTIDLNGAVLPGIELYALISELGGSNAILKAEKFDPNGKCDIEFDTIGDADDVVYLVHTGLDTNGDGSITGEEQLIFPSDENVPYLTITAVQSEDLDPSYDPGVVENLLYLSNLGSGIDNDFLKLFMSSISSLPGGTPLPDLHASITDEPPTHIAGSAYDPSDGSTLIRCIELPNGSNASNRIEDEFSTAVGVGLHGVSRKIMEDNTAAIWSVFSTGATSAVLTYPIPPNTPVSFYYGVGSGGSDLRLAYGGASFESGSIKYGFDKSGTKIIANSIEIVGTIKDVYDFDFTRGSGTFSRRAAKVQIGWEPPRNYGYIFKTKTNVSVVYDSTSTLSPHPITFFNDNGYIDSGVFVSTGGGSGGSGGGVGN